MDADFNDEGRYVVYPESPREAFILGALWAEWNEWPDDLFGDRVAISMGYLEDEDD